MIWAPFYLLSAIWNRLVKCLFKFIFSLYVRETLFFSLISSVFLVLVRIRQSCPMYYKYLFPGCGLTFVLELHFDEKYLIFMNINLHFSLARFFYYLEFQFSFHPMSFGFHCSSCSFEDNMLPSGCFNFFSFTWFQKNTNIGVFFFGFILLCMGL